jgi:hypothetical protein
VQVGRTVGVELVEQLLVPDTAEEADPVVGQLVHLPGVLVGVGRGADHHQRQGRATAPVAVDDDVDVVLRLEPGDHEVVAAWGQADVGQLVRRAAGDLRRSVGDLLGGGGELVAVVVGDALGVGDQRVGPADRQRLDHAVVALAHATPLGALPLQAVDVGGDRDAGRAQQRQPRRVRGVEHDGRVDPVPEHVAHGQPGVAQRLQRPAVHRRQVHQAHAQVGLRPGLVARGPAVDDDVVPGVGQPAADLLDGGLEAAVAGRDPPRADQRDAQLPRRVP